MMTGEKKQIPPRTLMLAVTVLSEAVPDLTAEKLASLLAKRDPDVAEATAKLLTYDDVAEILNCSPATVRRMVKRGVLKPVMVTEDTPRFRPSDIRLLIGAAA
jgi:excisionase family DNA binding protein